MSNIKPFNAVFYNKEKIRDIRKVIAPPYDVISPEEQTELHDLSPYNFTHIDFGKDKPGDDKTRNKYTRAKEIFASWIKDGILIQDDEPCIYLYKQEYKIMGQTYNRKGFIAAMELPKPDGVKVYPHEKTHAHAVEDRFKLTQALESNLSCIFVCYSDLQKKVEKVFSKHASEQEPLFDVTDKDRVRHTLWRLADKSQIAQIQAVLSGQSVFIADGHHRFQVANEYQAYRVAQKGKANGSEPFNYVMTYFTNIDSKDLKIFPMHRIVKKFPSDLSFLEEFFRMDKIKTMDDLTVLLAQAGRNEHAFGLYMRQGMFLLRLKNRMLIDQHIHEGSADYRGLDASILKAFVFDKIGVESTDIVYTKDIADVVSMVSDDRAQAGFVMNPVKISQLKAIALNGERMPPKTTYFYPKVLSGLVVYKMD